MKTNTKGMSTKFLKKDVETLVSKLTDALDAEGKVLCGFEVYIAPQSINTARYQYFSMKDKEMYVESITLEVGLGVNDGNE